MTIHCVVCHKPVRPSAALVRMTTGARLYAEDHAHRVRSAEDQGYFEIGPDCLRKVQKAGPAGYQL